MMKVGVSIYKMVKTKLIHMYLVLGLPKECLKEVYLVLGYQKSVVRRCTWSWVTKRVS